MWLTVLERIHTERIPYLEEQAFFFKGKNRFVECWFQPVVVGWYLRCVYCMCVYLFDVCGLFLCGYEMLRISFSVKEGTSFRRELFRHLVLILEFASRKIDFSHWLLKAKTKTTVSPKKLTVPSHRLLFAVFFAVAVNIKVHKTVRKC